MTVTDVDTRTVETGTIRRPGRARIVGHRVVGVLSWFALVLLVVWRLRDAPPWELPLPLGLLVVAVTAVLVALALLWARTADRRRRTVPA